MKHRTNEVVSRIARLISMLARSRQGVTIVQAARALEVSERQARRYLEAIEESFVTLVDAVEGDRGALVLRWRLPTDSEARRLQEAD